MYKAFEIATNMELISESDLEDWDAAITKVKRSDYLRQCHSCIIM